MSLKTICFLLCAVTYYSATSQGIRRIIPGTAITASNFAKPATTENKAADLIIKKGLLGKWKSESAVIEFRINGLHAIDWDNGSKDFGGWSINNRIMKFVVFKGEDEFDGSGDNNQYYFIISFTDKKMEYHELNTGLKVAPIQVAIKQGNQ